MLLIRNNFSKDYVESVLTGPLIQEPLFTIEQNWIQSDLHRGGKNFDSCVPNGRYDLEMFERANGDIVPRLVRACFDVYGDKPNEAEATGRWDILIHAGNYPSDVVGCIAPGLTHSRGIVYRSRDAMKIVIASAKHTPSILIESYATRTYKSLNENG